MTEQTCAADLNAAAELLERDGWCQGLLHDDAGRRCLLAALDDAVDAGADYGSLQYGLRFRAVKDVLRPRLLAVAPTACSFADWNDAPGRTAEEVVALLREAAKDRAIPGGIFGMVSGG